MRRLAAPGIQDGPPDEADKNTGNPASATPTVPSTRPPGPVNVTIAAFRLWTLIGSLNLIAICVSNGTPAQADQR